MWHKFQASRVYIATSLLFVATYATGTLYLSSTQATSISFNPKYEKIGNLGKLIAQEYGEFICPVPCETYHGTWLLPDEICPTATLSDILTSSLWLHQRVSIHINYPHFLFMSHIFPSPALKEWIKYLKKYL